MIVFAVIFERVLRIGRVDRRRARFQRFFDVKHRRQLIVGDAHQRHRLQCCALAGRDNAEDRFALVTHYVGGQRRLVVLAELDETEKRVEIDRHVCGPDDPFHARRARRRRIVDRANTRMRMRAAQNFQMQQIGEAVIVVVGRRAGDVAKDVLALRRLADLDEIIVAFVGENIFAEFEHSRCPQARRRVSLRAASSTASMIGS